MALILLVVLGILELRGVAMSYGGHNAIRVCSDSVPLTQNVNGHISFSPGSTVLNGTNATIQCAATDGQNLDYTKHNPLLMRIQKIIIFGPDLELLNQCDNVVDGKLQSCSHEIATTKGPGQFTYYCQFRTGITTFHCVSSQNLTVTTDPCLLKPCHPDAICIRAESSFQCKCKNGFTGDGRNCTVISRGTCSDFSILTIIVVVLLTLFVLI